MFGRSTAREIEQLESKMKHLVLTATILCMASWARAQQPSSMHFESSEWTIGRIREENGPITKRFVFTNTGTEPFVIERVSVSCGCTTPTYSRTPIMPSDTGSITLTFDPAGQGGTVNKSVYVISRSGNNRNTLTIRGSVAPKPRSVAEDYPFTVSEALRCDVTSIPFGYVAQGQTVSKVMKVMNFSNTQLKLDCRIVERSGVLSVDYPQILGPHRKADITVTYDLSHQTRYGMFTDGLMFSVDGVEPDLPISTSMVGIDDFSKVDRTMAPAAEISPMFYNFRRVDAGVKLHKVFAIRNNGRTPLYVRWLDCHNGVECDLSSNEEIAAGGERTFTVSFTPNGTSAGVVSGSIDIVTNDPETPLRKIRVAAELN